jgi:hypothetical protein
MQIQIPTLVAMKQNLKSLALDGCYIYHNIPTMHIAHIITMKNLNKHTLRQQGEKKSLEHKL